MKTKIEVELNKMIKHRFKVKSGLTGSKDDLKQNPREREKGEGGERERERSK